MEAIVASVLVFVGTYTGTGSQGIYVLRFDPATGSLQDTGLTAALTNPSFLTLSPDGRHLYAVTETAKTGDRPSGAVVAFAIDPASGALTELNRELSGGRGPCHVSVAADGKALFVANYGSGTVSMLPIAADGKLAPPVDTHQHEGQGPHPSRQKGPHAHSVTPDPWTGTLLACDLGLDKVLCYTVTPAGLQPAEPPFLSVPPGAGPRHVAFHPDGKVLFVVNEINSTVSVFRRSEFTAAFDLLQTLSTLPGGSTVASTCADIHTSRDGRFLYASNRGHDSIAIFAVDPLFGLLTPVGHEPVQGKTPRNFAVSPCGNWLLCANQDSDGITVFRVDPASGALTDSGQRAAVPRPVCVRFAP